MTEQDRMTAFILAKLRVLEAAVGGLLARSEHHEAVKELSVKVLEIYQNRALFESMSDEECAIAESAYRETYRALFGENLVE